MAKKTLTLAQQIDAQIEATGPMSLATYMALCLTHPRHGYYTAGRPIGAAGDFHELRALMDDRPLRIRVRTDRPRELAGALLGSGVVVGVRLEDHEVLELDTTDARALTHALAPTAREIDARLLEVRALDADLEGVFRYVVQR